MTKTKEVFELTPELLEGRLHDWVDDMGFAFHGSLDDFKENISFLVFDMKRQKDLGKSQFSVFLKQ